MTDPSSEFNADESGFNLDPSELRAIGIRGKPLNRITGGSGRESVTVLACVLMMAGNSRHRLYSKERQCKHVGLLLEDSREPWMRHLIRDGWRSPNFTTGLPTVLFLTWTKNGLRRDAQINKHSPNYFEGNKCTWGCIEDCRANPMMEEQICQE